jgi:hypothetical protein
LLSFGRATGEQPFLALDSKFCAFKAAMLFKNPNGDREGKDASRVNLISIKVQLMDFGYWLRRRRNALE